MQPFLPLLLAALPLPGRPGVPGQAALEKTLRQAAAVACPASTLAIDPDLTRAATAFVKAAQAGRAPPSVPALSFYAALESYEPSPVAAIVRVSPAANADRAVGDLLSGGCHFNRAGIAAASVARGEAVVALLTAAHTSELNHLPGHVQPGAEIQIDATLAPGLTSPRLFVLRPGGVAEEQPVSSDGQRVRARVKLAQRGAYTVELLGAGQGGPQIAAIRRIFAGVAPPAAPPREARDGERGVAAVEHAIARLRAAHGLPALQRDPELDRVAEGHSSEMARSRTFAHTLSSDGNMTDRLRKARYAYQVAGENIGLAVTPIGAHEAVASSPAHLANLLDPHYRRLGLGTAVGATPDGGEGVYLTEVLATPMEISADPESEVARLLQQKRRTLGLAPLDRDASLDELATRQVRALISAGEPSQELQRVVDEALRAHPRLRSAVAEAFVGTGAHATDRSRNVAERGWTRFGVGAIYANADTYGERQLWVLLLYAR